MSETKLSILKDRVRNVFLRAVLGGALFFPYKRRVAMVGWFAAKILAPLAGWRKRVRDNLALVAPETAPDEVERITDRVCNNVGRALIEIYSGDEFVERVKRSEMGGPGLDALMAAKDGNRPIVFLTAHLGNYDAVRGKLSRDGFPMAALFRPLNNVGFNKHYVKAISTIADPVFPSDRNGVTGLVRHLKDGGNIGIVADVSFVNAPLLEFFGKPAHTPVSSAEWALKYNALMIPVFGIRKVDGLNFRIHVCETIAHSTPEVMMQAYNDVVEGVVRAHIDQWFWVHRRWKRPAPRA